MATPLQRDNLGLLRYAADVCWRDSASNLADNVIAGALRTLECDVDLFQRLLGDAALQEIERETYNGIQLQVRTMRLERFPCLSLPIRLDWRRAWSVEKWTSFQTSVQTMAAGPAKTALEAKIAKVQDCFGVDSPPFSVSYPGCDGERVTIDPNGLELMNSGAGDQILLKDTCNTCCAWPNNHWWGLNLSHQWNRWGFHDVPNNRYVEVRYVVGFATSDELLQNEPMIAANIAALFNYRYENPEIMGAQATRNTQLTYMLLMQHFQKHLKWRV
jgi:hypothetical protein